MHFLPFIECMLKPISPNCIGYSSSKQQTRQNESKLEKSVHTHISIYFAISAASSLYYRPPSRATSSPQNSLWTCENNYLPPN